jgi:hypothetical protein
MHLGSIMDRITPASFRELADLYSTIEYTLTDVFGRTTLSARDLERLKAQVEANGVVTADELFMLSGLYGIGVTDPDLATEESYFVPPEVKQSFAEYLGEHGVQV